MPTDDSQVKRLRDKIQTLEATLHNLKNELAAAEAQRNGQPNGLQRSEKPDKGAEVDEWPWPLQQSEYQRYGRQMIVPQVGLEGQLNLKKSKVLIVGVGGLGCPAAAYLAGAGVGTLGLVDGDTVELSNLHRQILHTEGRVGMKKVDSAVERLRKSNSSLNYQTHPAHLTPTTALPLFRDYDLILDCTDHPTSRYLISDAAVLAGKPLVSASALGTEGQSMVLNNPPSKRGLSDKQKEAYDGNNHKGFCYRCAFPKPPPSESVKSCGEGGILGPVVGVMGVLMAVEALKILTTSRKSQQNTQLPQPSLLLYSATDTTPFRTVRLKGRRANCVACSHTATITPESLTSGSLDYAAFCGVNALVNILPLEDRISASEYKSYRTQENGKHILVDVREKVQFDICHLPNSINIPFSDISRDASKSLVHLDELADIDGDSREKKGLVFLCRFGNDSQIALKKFNELEGEGYKSKWGENKDLIGGLAAWTKEVDPTFPVY